MKKMAMKVRRRKKKTEKGGDDALVLTPLYIENNIP